MNNRFFKVVMLGLVMVLTLAPLNLVYGAVPDPTDQFYVNDYANVIDSDIENLLVHNGNLLYQENGAQIVLVTVDFVGSKSMEEYATELFNSWGIGSADKNNGLLILLSIGDDDYWVLQGKGLESTLKTSLISEFNNEYLEPDFAAQNYGQGAAKVYRAFTEKLGGTWSTETGGNRGINASPGGGQTPGSQPGYESPARGGRGSNFFGMLLLFMIILIIVSSNRRRYYRRRYGIPFNPYSRRRVRRYGTGGYWGHYGPPPMGGGFWYGGRWNTSPKPKHRRHNPPPPRGGGFWGGGGSPGSGGSGRPSGGSFWGSSSGGGGSSRGGGAGRSSSSWGGGGRSSSGKSPFSGGSFGGGRSFGGGGKSFGGGGSSRGGGAGRGK